MRGTLAKPGGTGHRSKLVLWHNESPEWVLSPKLYEDVPAGPWKFDFLYTNFSHNYPPISIPFSKEKHPILFKFKLGAFCHNLLKIHPIYVIWVHFWWKPIDRYTKFRKKKNIPKGRHRYVLYHVNVRPPQNESLRFSNAVCGMSIRHLVPMITVWLFIIRILCRCLKNKF